jgi:ABC-type Zn uptake system ZnuABC Zn-binding protein ZnuA
MNKLITFLILITILTSCKEEEQTQEQQTVYTQVYNTGDVLYLKPDSLKAVVQDFDKSDGTYQMFWREGEEYPHIWVSESMIYGTVSTIQEELYE